MRQITLGASLVRRGLRVVLWCHEIPGSLRMRAIRHKLEVVHRTWSQESEDAEISAEWPNVSVIVFDGYLFSSRVISACRRVGRIVMVIDDNGDHSRVDCDLIVNQNLHASSLMYPSSGQSPELLLGTKWALIRPEVAALAQESPTPSREGVFISIGGLDPHGLAVRLGEIARTRRDWPVCLAGGFSANPPMSPDEMARRMWMSRTGLIAFGTTTWESLCLGLPVVGLVVADNQLKVGESIEAAGLGQLFDFRSSGDPSAVMDALSGLYDDVEALRERAARGRDLVDGAGATRVAARIMELIRS